MSEKFVMVNEDMQKKFKKGDHIITEGDVGYSMYYIIEGEAVVIKKGVVLSTLQKGDAFGEMALIIDTPRTANVMALSDITVMEVNRKMFQIAMSNMSQWEHSLMKNLCERLKNISELFVMQGVSYLEMRSLLLVLSGYMNNKIPVAMVIDLYERIYQMSAVEIQNKLKELENDGTISRFGDMVSVK